MLVKIHKSYRTVVAICDEEIIGKRFEQGKRQLDLTSTFFQGEKKTEEETLEIISQQADEDATFNIAGEKAVQLALKSGIIQKSGVRNVQKIPFALVLL